VTKPPDSAAVTPAPSVSTKHLLKIDQQLRLPQRHRLRSRDDSIADQRPSIFNYFNCRLLMIIIYMAGVLNYAHKIAVFDFNLLKILCSHGVVDRKY